MYCIQPYYSQLPLVLQAEKICSIILRLIQLSSQGIYKSGYLRVIQLLSLSKQNLVCDRNQSLIVQHPQNIWVSRYNKLPTTGVKGNLTHQDKYLTDRFFFKKKKGNEILIYELTKKLGFSQQENIMLRKVILIFTGQVRSIDHQSCQEY